MKSPRVLSFKEVHISFKLEKRQLIRKGIMGREGPWGGRKGWYPRYRWREMTLFDTVFLKLVPKVWCSYGCWLASFSWETEIVSMWRCLFSLVNERRPCQLKVMGEVRGSEVWGDPGRKGNEYFYQHWGPKKNVYVTFKIRETTLFKKWIHCNSYVLCKTYILFSL